MRQTNETKDFRALSRTAPWGWYRCIRCECVATTPFQRGAMVLCSRCASNARRTEIDRWLQEIDARMIRVKDLGAALDAGVMGGALVQLMTGAKDRNTRAGYVDRLTHLTAMVTAGEARLALGYD